MIQKYNMTPNATVTQPNEKRGGGGGDEKEKGGDLDYHKGCNMIEDDKRKAHMV